MYTLIYYTYDAWRNGELGGSKEPQLLETVPYSIYKHHNSVNGGKGSVSLKTSINLIKYIIINHNCDAHYSAGGVLHQATPIISTKIHKNSIPWSQYFSPTDTASYDIRIQNSINNINMSCTYSTGRGDIALQVNFNIEVYG